MNEISVFGVKLNPKLFPKLYQLGLKDIERVKLILRIIQENCVLGSYKRTAKEIETKEPVEVAGILVDILDYPAMYCWFAKKPSSFVSFFEEISERIWGGDKREALKMMEQYFESKYRGE